MKRHSTIFGILATIVALNYFAYRVELFDRENEAFHPSHSTSPALTLPTLNWETFDKDNAPQAIVINVEIVNNLLFVTPSEQCNYHIDIAPRSLVHDKSPPSLAS